LLFDASRRAPVCAIQDVGDGFLDAQGRDAVGLVVGKKLPHFSIELGGQGLVGREDQGGSLRVGDDIGDGVGLAGISRGLEIGMELE